MIRSWEGANHIPNYFFIEDVVKHTGHLDGAKKTDELRVVERGLGWFRSHGFEPVFWVGNRTNCHTKGGAGLEGQGSLSMAFQDPLCPLESPDKHHMTSYA